MNRRAQSWSMDVVLAVVIFGFISVTFTSFALLDRPNVQSLQQNAQQVSNELSNPLPQCGLDRVLQGSVLDANATDCLFRQNYTAVREQFRSEQDFCIYLEDADGKLIQVNNRSGFGSDKVNISGVPCGQQT